MRGSSVVVYIYGPPAVGKLTVARALAEQTRLPLFHNHLTVSALTPVFEFRSPAFVELVHRLRLDVFATATRHRISMIFTNNSVWGGPETRADFAAFASDAEATIRSAGGEVLFVHLTAPPDVLMSRVSNASRLEHGKLVDSDRPREHLDGHDMGPLDSAHLSIDTSAHEPRHAARLIADCLG